MIVEVNKTESRPWTDCSNSQDEKWTEYSVPKLAQPLTKFQRASWLR